MQASLIERWSLLNNKALGSSLRNLDVGFSSATHWFVGYQLVSFISTRLVGLSQMRFLLCMYLFGWLKKNGQKEIEIEW